MGGSNPLAPNKKKETKMKKLIFIVSIIFMSMTAFCQEVEYNSEKKVMIVEDKDSNDVYFALSTNHTYSAQEVYDIITTIGIQKEAYKEMIGKSASGVIANILKWSAIILGAVASLSALVVGLLQIIGGIVMRTKKLPLNPFHKVIDFFQKDFLPVLINLLTARFSTVK